MSASPAELKMVGARTVLHWYDFICPFCYVDQQRNTILLRRGLDVVELPFQAHPEIPAGGIAVGPRDGPMYAMLEREAKAAGLPLRWPRRLPNTRSALAAAEWTRRFQPRALSSTPSSPLRGALRVRRKSRGPSSDRLARDGGGYRPRVHARCARGWERRGCGQGIREAGTQQWSLRHARLVFGRTTDPGASAAGGVRAPVHQLVASRTLHEVHYQRSITNR